MAMPSIQHEEGVLMLSYFWNKLSFVIIISTFFVMGLCNQAQSKMTFYLIDGTDDPEPSLASCMSVINNGTLIQAEDNLWHFNYEIWEIFFTEKMLFCHKHGVIYPRGERVD